MKKVFLAFMEKVASPQRPIYYHTDDKSLRLAFQLLKNESLWPADLPQPSILPFT